MNWPARIDFSSNRMFKIKVPFETIQVQKNSTQEGRFPNVPGEQ